MSLNKSPEEQWCLSWKFVHGVFAIFLCQGEGDVDFLMVLPTTWIARQAIQTHWCWSLERKQTTLQLLISMYVYCWLNASMRENYILTTWSHRAKMHQQNIASNCYQKSATLPRLVNHLTNFGHLTSASVCTEWPLLRNVPMVGTSKFSWQRSTKSIVLGNFNLQIYPFRNHYFWLEVFFSHLG